MTLTLAGTNQTTIRARVARPTVIGALALLTGTVGWTGWLAWRLTTLGLHPVELAVFACELAGVAAGLAIAAGLTPPERATGGVAPGRRDADRFASVVAGAVGRGHTIDPHRDLGPTLRAAYRAVLGRHPIGVADLAVGGLVVDGPRRLGLVVALTVGLLVGVAPFPLPPAWSLACAAVGVGATAVGHVALGRGRIRFGDRLRWSYAAIGETVGRDDRVGLAPRRWVGTVATVVVLSLAIALRGISDRWTHGLPAMDHRERVVAMAVAALVAAGAVLTMSTTAAPENDPRADPRADRDAVPARLGQERAARRSALGAAVSVGLVGLVAGLVPPSSDPASDRPDDRSARLERSEQAVDEPVPARPSERGRP